MSTALREKITESALELFNSQGYHETAIEDVLDHAQLDRPAFDEEFESKEALVLEALSRRDEWVRTYFIGEMERRGQTPAERILALFDVMEEWFAQGTFQGCMFINASAEYGQRDNPIYQAAADHKRLFLEYLTSLAKQIDPNGAEDLADEIAFLMEGAIVTAHMRGTPAPAQKARRAAAALIARCVEPAAAR